jgi:hypothetical protein
MEDLSTWEKEEFCKTFGCPRSVATYMAKKTATTLNEVCFCLYVARANVTWDLVSLASGIFFPRRISEREARRRFTEVATKIKSAEFVDPKIRFNAEHLDGRFPGCTAIVDVTPIYCRQLRKGFSQRGDPIDTTYQPKYKTRVWKVEVWTTLSGIPIAWRGPVEGRVNDMRLFRQGGQPFHHTATEVFLADLGYIGGNHCMTSWKTGEPDVGENKKEFENNLSIVRSRIERAFAWLLKYRFFEHSAFEIPMLDLLLAIVMATEHLMGKLYPHYSVTPYPEDTPLPAKLGDTLTCMCNFEEDREAVNMAKRHRTEVSEVYLRQHPEFQTSHLPKRPSANAKK